MQEVDRGKDILSFRMDDQKQRLTITGNKGDNLGFLGWEVENSYWVDDKGFVWKSEQFISPKLPSFSVEITKKPYVE